MKNIWYICLLALVVFGCEQKDSFYYEEQAELYFVSAIGEPAGSMSKNIDFAFRRTGQMDMNYMYNLYYGDSLRMDSIQLVVSLLGEVSDQPREYNLEIVTPDSLPQSQVILRNPYVLEANATRDTIVILVPRPESRGEFRVDLAFAESPDFGKSSFQDAGKYTITITDRYPKPAGWEDYIYGEYSEEKYAFWVTVLQAVYQDKWAFYDMYWMPTTRIDELIAALRAYNAAHPDAPKDFTFPGM